MFKIEPFQAGHSRYYDLDVDFHQPNSYPVRVYITYLGGWYQVEVRNGYMVELRLEHSRLATIGQLLELAAITGTILVGMKTKIVEFGSSLRLYRGLEDVPRPECWSRSRTHFFDPLPLGQNTMCMSSVTDWGTGVLWTLDLLPIRLCGRCEPSRITVTRRLHVKEDES